jgi:hypothetical protein
MLSRSECDTLILVAFAAGEHRDANLDVFLALALPLPARYHVALIINGNVSPSRSAQLNATSSAFGNFEVVSRINSGFDMCAYRAVLTGSLPLARAPRLPRRFARFIVLNMSLRGPLLPAWAPVPWPEIYLARLSPTVKLSGTMINCWQERIHLQSTLLAFDRSMLANVTAAFICSNWKWALVLSGEIGLSQAVIAANHSVASALALWGMHDFAADHSASVRRCLTMINPIPSAPDSDAWGPRRYAKGSLEPTEVVFYKTNRKRVPSLDTRLAAAVMARPWSLPADILCASSSSSNSAR